MKFVDSLALLQLSGKIVLRHHILLVQSILLSAIMVASAHIKRRLVTFVSSKGKERRKKKKSFFFISLKQIFFSCFYFILFVSWHSLVCLNVSFCSGWSQCKSVLLEIVTWRCDVASTHLFSFVLVNLSGQGGFFSQSPCPYCVRKKGTAATCWHRFMCCQLVVFFCFFFCRCCF